MPEIPVGAFAINRRQARCLLFLVVDARLLVLTQYKPRPSGSAEASTVISLARGATQMWCCCGSRNGTYTSQSAKSLAEEPLPVVSKQEQRGGAAASRNLLPPEVGGKEILYTGWERLHNCPGGGQVPIITHGDIVLTVGFSSVRNRVQVWLAQVQRRLQQNRDSASTACLAMHGKERQWGTDFH